MSAATGRGRFDPAFLVDVRARASLAGIVGRHVTLKRRGHEHVGLCPFHGERTPSFGVREDKGFAHCFGCGWTGDAIAFVRDLLGVPFAEAVEIVAGEVGLLPQRDGRRVALAPPVPRRSAADEEQAQRFQRQAASDVWAAAGVIAGTPGEAYFRRRGITVPLPPTLRFHPGLKHKASGGKLPAIVAAVWNADRSLRTVHRYWIDGQGGKAAVEAVKMAYSGYAGAAIRLTRPAARLAIAEGVENALAAGQPFWDAELAQPVIEGQPVALWSAVALSNLAGSGMGRGPEHPEKPDQPLPSAVPNPTRPGVILPDWARDVLILADADGDIHVVRQLVTRAARRWSAEGRTVKVAWPPKGSDFNDLVKPQAGETAAVEVVPPESVAA